MTDTLSVMALEAVQRYTSLLSVFRALYYQAMRSDPAIASVKQDVWNAAVDASKAYLSAEKQLIDTDTTEVVWEALESVYSAFGENQVDEMPDVLTEHFETTSDILHRAVAAQVERDLATLLREISNAALRIEMQMQATGMTRTQSMLNVAAQDHSMEFRFLDRIGRRYQSSKHIRDQYRLHLLTSWAESFLHTASVFGETEVAVVTPEPSAKVNGMRLAIAPGSSAPSFYSVQNEIFHPTSAARLQIVGVE